VKAEGIKTLIHNKLFGLRHEDLGGKTLMIGMKLMHGLKD